MIGGRTAAARRLAAVALGAVVGGFFCLGAATAQTPDAAAVARGAYLFAAADCASCHTDTKAKGAPLAGGPPLVTPFGTFFAPNITPDRRSGIGNWSEALFRQALRNGRGPGGEFLYPVFPYPSFTGMTDQDIADLYAFLRNQAPAARPDRPQQAKFPFGFRPLLFFWRTLFFRPGPLAPVAAQSAQWNRGRYLATAVAHCEECHTPRNLLGALDESHAYAGNPHGPDKQDAPNITQDAATGIGKWSVDDIATLLKSGQTPEFDFVGSGMTQVVDGTSKLTDADRQAIAVYIKSLPARRATPK